MVEREEEKNVQGRGNIQISQVSHAISYSEVVTDRCRVEMVKVYLPLHSKPSSTSSTSQAPRA